MALIFDLVVLSASAEELAVYVARLALVLAELLAVQLEQLRPPYMVLFLPYLFIFQVISNVRKLILVDDYQAFEV